jgi:hypothetical protein
MAKKASDKQTAPAPAAEYAGLFDVQVGEKKTIADMSCMGVPSGYIVYHGQTACFVPAIETPEAEEAQ